MRINQDVILDFWATWCGPCVAELPEIKKVFDEHNDDGFEVVGISLDRSQEPLDRFLESNDYEWTQIYFAGEERRNAIKDRFGVTGIPALFLIDQQGKVVAGNLRGHDSIAKAVAELLDAGVSMRAEVAN